MDEYAKMDRKTLRAARAKPTRKKRQRLPKRSPRRTTPRQARDARVESIPRLTKIPRSRPLSIQLIGERKAHRYARRADALKAEQAAVRAEQRAQKFVAEAAGIYSPDEAREHSKPGSDGGAQCAGGPQKAGVGREACSREAHRWARRPLEATDIGDGMIMFQGMAYKDMGVAKRAREISAELRKQDQRQSTATSPEALKWRARWKGRV